MNQVSGILERMNLTRSDLNDLNPDLIQEMFLDLSVSKISRLCRVSKSFDSVCQRESLWQNKVWIDYGVEKKYGETWRETAKLLSEVNMINLNKKWVNGETYKQILTKAWNKRKEGLKYLITLQVNAFYDVIPDHDLAVTLQYINLGPADEETIREVVKDNIYDIDREFTDDDFDRFLEIRSKEFSILFATLTVLAQSYPLLPSQSYRSYGIEIKSVFLSIIKLIDPIPYIMQFSVLSREDIEELNFGLDEI